MKKDATSISFSIVMCNIVPSMYFGPHALEKMYFSPESCDDFYVSFVFFFLLFNIAEVDVSFSFD